MKGPFIHIRFAVLEMSIQSPTNAFDRDSAMPLNLFIDVKVSIRESSLAVSG